MVSIDVRLSKSEVNKTLEKIRCSSKKDKEKVEDNNTETLQNTFLPFHIIFPRWTFHLWNPGEQLIRIVRIGSPVLVVAAGELDEDFLLRPRSTVEKLDSRKGNERFATIGTAHHDRHVAWLRSRTRQRGLRVLC